MKRILITLSALLFCADRLQAQQSHFTSSGTIEFEKTVNSYALIKKGQIFGKNTQGNQQRLFEQYQPAHPQFMVLKSTLSFANNKTLLVPIADQDAGTGLGFNIPMAAQNNTVYCDRVAGTTIVQKNIFGDSFLLTDSARKIKWKITGETREIAGYPCRRANGLIMDSIYVVAFYTEKIHVPGGPESFGGLPGMILEVALPHENVTWRAIKVTDMALSDNAVKAPKNGKAISRQGLVDLIKRLGQNWTAEQTALMMKVNLL